MISGLSNSDDLIFLLPVTFLDEFPAGDGK